MATLKEIARAAGVSTTTVSNVINGNASRVSAETARRIQDIIDGLGYVPNQAARSLAQRESRIIAVVIQADEGENIFLNPYNAAFAGALTVKLYQNGYYPLIRFSDDFRTIDADIRGWNVAGLIYNGAYTRQLQYIKSLDAIPSVFVDCYFREEAVNHVGAEDEAGGRIAGEYLARLGHRRVAYMSNMLSDSVVEQRRLTGLRRSLGEAGLDIRDEWIFPTSDLDALAPRLRALLSGPNAPTAFFCAADQVAVRLMAHFKALGYAVPRDISVIGFDDLPIAAICAPGLTTIAQNVDQKAQLVVDMLLRHIQNRDLPPESARIGVRLVERESAAAPKTPMER